MAALTCAMAGDYPGAGTWSGWGSKSLADLVRGHSTWYAGGLLVFSQASSDLGELDSGIAAAPHGRHARLYVIARSYIPYGLHWLRSGLDKASFFTGMALGFGIGSWEAHYCWVWVWILFYDTPSASTK